MTAFIHCPAQPHISPLSLFSSLESIYSCFIQSVTAYESVPLGSSSTAGRTESRATRSSPCYTICPICVLHFIAGLQLYIRNKTAGDVLLQENNQE